MTKKETKSRNPQTDGAAVQHLSDLLDKKLGGDQAAQEELYRLLLAQAEGAAQKSYSPYSDFPVGAAALTKSGQVFLGCNVENASYGGTICAERTALVKGVSEGFKDFQIIAVSCSKIKDAWPCGLCRQFISEFGAGIEIVSESQDGSIKVMKISELLPHLFGPAALGL